MKQHLISLAALALLGSTPAQSQTITAYIGTDRTTTKVDDTHRLPVANGPSGQPASALESVSANNASGATAFSGASVLYSITVTLASGDGPLRLMVWDSVAVPADGPLSGATLPMRCVYVPAGPGTSIFSSMAGLAMRTGITWTLSSGADCQTKTSTTGNFVAVSYKAPTA